MSSFSFKTLLSALEFLYLNNKIFL